MTRKQMYSHLVTMLAAGHDTTAFCTCYTLFLLAKNPEARGASRRIASSGRLIDSTGPWAARLQTTPINPFYLTTPFHPDHRSRRS